MKTFKDEILAFLAWKQIKVYDLAKLAGISHSSLYRYLNDDRDLRLKTVEKLRAIMEK